MRALTDMDGRAPIDTAVRLLHEERGNTIIILTTICLLFIGATLFSLDIFSVLISRRYAQTDADAAATAGVQAVQPIVMEELMKSAQAKIERLVNEAVAEWELAKAKAQQNEKEAADDSDEGEDEEETSEDGEGDPSSQDEEDTTPIEDEDEDGDAPFTPTRPPLDPMPFLVRKLADNIPDTHVVAYILKQVNTPPAPHTFISAVLTAEERGCALERVRVQAEAAARGRAEQMIRDPHLAVIQSVTFPYHDNPWVVVELHRPVPSLFLRRVMTSTPVVRVSASAAVRGMSNITWLQCP